MGTPYKNLTKEERALLQSKTDLIYEYFVRDVADNRNMDYQEVLSLADGSVYLGVEAIDNGLVDELGNLNEVKEYLYTALNVTEIQIYTFSRPKGFLERLSEVSAEPFYAMGQGIGDTFRVKDEGFLPQLR